MTYVYDNAYVGDLGAFISSDALPDSTTVGIRHRSGIKFVNSTVGGVQ
jgi:hypothetical protein